MNLFKRNNSINPYNIGDTFLMKVELIEIRSEGDNILYKIKPIFKDSSAIYGITLDNLKEMEIK